VKQLGEFGSAFAGASVKEAKIPSNRQALSGQKVQMALRNANPRQTMLQAEVLWDKDPPVYPNDALAFLLHTAVRVLLESAEWRPANHVGRDETASVGFG